MRHPDQRGSDRNTSGQGTPLAAWLPVLAVMAILIMGCASTFLVLQLDEFRPTVGDIVSFAPGSQDPDMWEMKIPASMLARSGEVVGECTLDPNMMAVKGGSLVVEGRRTVPSLQYWVHWAGAQTAQGGGGCGTSAELEVSRADLQRLANSAGGFGVHDKGITQ